MSQTIPDLHAKRLNLILLPLVITTALAVSLTENSRADVIIFANSTSNLGNGPGSQTGTTGTVSDTGGGIFDTDITKSRSSATHAQLKAYASAEDGIGGTTGGTFAFSRAYWRDNFLFNKDGLDGTFGIAEMKFKIDGTLSASRTALTNAYQPGSDDGVQAFAQYTFSFGVSPGINQGSTGLTERMRTEQYAAALGTNPHEGTPFLGIEQTFLVPFKYGTVLEGVGLELFIGAQGIGYDGGVQFSSNAKADLEHTANWLGFGAVRDANGNIVTDYTFSSGSGYNYALGITAIPEPSSCLLLLVASATSLLRRNRRTL